MSSKKKYYWRSKGWNPDGKCSICSEEFSMTGFHGHNRFKHQNQAKMIPYPPKVRDVTADEPRTKLASPAPYPADGTTAHAQAQAFEYVEKKGGGANEEMTGWISKTGQSLYWRPTPIAEMVINHFKVGADPSDVVNLSLMEFARNRGIEPAIITTEKGKMYKLLGEPTDKTKMEDLITLVKAEADLKRSDSASNPLTLIDVQDDGVDLNEMMMYMMMMKMLKE